MKLIRWIFTIAVLMLAIAGGLSIASLWGFIEIPALDGMTPKAAEPEVDVRSQVVKALEGASELTSATMTIETVVPVESDREIAGIAIGTTSLVYVANGTVRAGVDLSEATVFDDGETARVVLPGPTIQGINLNVELSDTVGYSRGTLGLGPDNGVELQAIAQKKAIAKMSESACSSGILEKARESAQEELSRLLSPIHGDVVVEVGEGECIVIESNNEV